jgi:hypothetical protein
LPYIDQEARKRIGLYRESPKTAGELNYLITNLLLDYYRNRGARYQQINDVLGALEGAKHEFYRRIVGKYEDQKIKENGDVY